MENNNNDVFTIKITKKDKVLFDYITQLDVEPGNEKDDERVKKLLELAIDSYQSNIAGPASTSFPAPEVLKEKIKDKKKEELIAIRESLVNDILNYASLFDQNLVDSGVFCYPQDPKSWNISAYSPVAYITLFSNYIQVIDSLLNKKQVTKEKDLNSLLDLICASNENRSKANKKTMVKFVKRYLTPLEAKIIIARYGLESEKGKSLLDISKELSMTREKIRQIGERAIYKLRRESLEQESEKEIYNIK